LKTFGDGQKRITDYGTRSGLSATIVLDPVIELYKAIGDRRYLAFAELIIREIDEQDGLRLISQALRRRDVEN